MMKFLFYFCLGILGLVSCSEPVEPKPNAAIDRLSTNFVKSFLPENNYHESQDIIGNVGEITEEDFNVIVDSALEIYRPIFNDLGLELNIYSDWKSTTVNAYCNRTGNNVEVSLFGGLARHKNMSFEGMVIVTCHELFHAIGGAPFYPDSDWPATSEGGSDYGAAAACARKMFDSNSPLAYRSIWKRKNPEQPSDTNQPCYKAGIDKKVCELTLQGGLSLGRVLASLNGESMPTYDRLDLTKIKKTQYTHPKSACRLTQYFAGATCPKIWTDTIIPQNLNEGKSFQCRELMGCWLNEKSL